MASNLFAGKLKWILAFAVAAIILGAAAVAVKMTEPPSIDTAVGGKLFPEFSPADATGLAFTKGAQKTTLAKDAKGWVVRELDNYAADDQKIATFLSQASEMKRDDVRGNKPEKHRIYGLAEDDTLLVEITGASAKPLASFYSGRPGDVGPSSFVRVKGSDEVLLVDRPLAAASSADPSDWVEKGLFKFDAAKVKTISGAGKFGGVDMRYRLTKMQANDKGEATWSLDGAGIPADTATVSTMLNNVVNLNLRKVLLDKKDPVELGLSPAEFEFEVELDDNSRHKLLFGKEDADSKDLYASMEGRPYFFMLSVSDLRHFARKPEELLKKEICKVDPNALEKIEFNYPSGDAVMCEREPNTREWKITSPRQYVGDSTSFAGVTNTVRSFMATSAVMDPVKDGVDPAKWTQKITFVETGDKRTAITLLGPSADGSLYHVMRDGSPTIFAVAKGFGDNLAKGMNDLVDRRPLIMQVSEVEAFSVTTAEGKVFEFAKTNGLWQVVAGAEKGDAAKIQGVLQSICFMRAKRVEFGQMPALTEVFAKVALKVKGEAIELNLFSSGEKDALLQMPGLDHYFVFDRTVIGFMNVTAEGLQVDPAPEGPPGPKKGKD